MKRSTVSGIVFVFVLLVLAAGPSLASPAPLGAVAATKTFLPLVAGPTPFDGPGNPRTLTTTLDTSHAVTVQVPTAGGTVSTTAADGTRLTLTVPADALLQPTAITLTPVASARNLPSGVTFVAGADLRPDGLRLYQVATLTIDPPAATLPQPGDEVAFASHPDGANAYRYPLEIQPRTPTFPLIHFSLYYLGDGKWTSSEPTLPTLSEDRLQQLMHDLLQHERDALLQNQPGDPQFGQKFDYLMRQYYNVAIAPNLAASKEDCATAETSIPKAIGWQRQLDVLGGAGAFAAEEAAIHDAWITSMDTCWNEIAKPCMVKSNPNVLQRVISLARQAAILGLGDRYDPSTIPPCDCGKVAQITKGWNLALSFSYSGQAVGTRAGSAGVTTATARRAANVMASLNTRPTGESWESHLTGTAEINDLERTVYQNPPLITTQTEVGSGSPSTTDKPGAPVKATLLVSPTACTYSLWVPIRMNTVRTNIDGSTQVVDEVIANFSVPGTEPLNWTAATTDFTIRGRRTLPINVEGYRPRIYFSTSVGYNDIVVLTGLPGEVAVDWSLTPIP